ncbi:MAG: hypothetical protein HC902_12270 [Calothrix sp. SM1_5_4]|nr:hypothetical protein [Calothrix sp. SM1_5_4]
MRKYLPLLLLLATGCAQLHHVQIGEIDNRPGYVKKPFDIKISETGVNLEEAAGVARAVLDEKGKEAAQNVAAVIGLFQMGPRTGNPVYVKDYAKNLIQQIYEKCPSGNVTGLTSIRETRKYPVVSGEIVKVTGYCLIPKEG